MKPNVDFIIKDWKENWSGEEITKLIYKMPRDNVIEIFLQPVSDDDVMISCPLALASLMRDEMDVDIPGWIFDYGCFDESEGMQGLYWDGEELWVIHQGELIPMKTWEGIAERIME